MGREALPRLLLLLPKKKFREVNIILKGRHELICNNRVCVVYMYVSPPPPVVVNKPKEDKNQA
jgi:hypothetical protein